MSSPDTVFSNTSILLVAEEENKHIFLFKRKRPITSLKGFGFILQSEVWDIMPGLLSFDQFFEMADWLFFGMFRYE